MLQALGTNTNKGESPKMALQILCLDNQEQAKTQLKIITNRTGGDSQKEAIGRWSQSIVTRRGHPNIL